MLLENSRKLKPETKTRAFLTPCFPNMSNGAKPYLCVFNCINLYMSKGEKTRRLAAIMFTDIVGYTALMQQNEARASKVRDRHREVFDAEHSRYHGDILQYFGDGTLSVFQSGVEAVECAVAIQQALNTGDPVPLRIGLHLGDIVFDGTDIYGDGVNLASRIESMGVAGAILLSGKLNEELKNHQQITTRSLGLFELKNIEQPVEVFSVTNPGITVPARTELKGKQKTPQKSIAVLPFVNISADPENEYFSDGMTEEIINALTKVKNLKVTSRTSSFYFKNKHIPIPQIGRELDVSIILEGSIRLADNRMRITAQLIDVADDVHFWSETFDRSVDDIFAVQDEISLLIADKLREQIGHLEIGEHLIDAPDIPVDTYKQYLKARYHLLKMSRADLEKGMAIMEDILAAHPEFALAYLGVHLGYTLLGTIGLMPAGEAFAKGHPYLEKAISLEPDLPECQLHLAWISFLQHWDLNSAYQHLNKALETRSTVDFYQSMATTLVAEGKFAAAHHYIETALQLDPFSEINYHLQGFIFYAQEKYEQAIAAFDKSISLKANFSISTLYRGQALICAGRAAECLQFFQQLPEDEPGDILKLGGTTLAYAALGDLERAEAGFCKLEAAMQTDLLERALNLLILCQTVLGRTTETLELIGQAITYRLPLLVYLNVDPILKPLRAEPRFQQYMKQVLGEKTTFDLPESKYKKALFTKKELEQYKKALTTLMATQKPYLNPDLSLRDLALLLDMPANQLSQLLNEGFEKNFAEYINTYRLEAFKKMVADPGSRHLTLLAMAYECGFNSKTVFNTFFKKQTGKTPRAYWKEVVG
ncbi:MAG: helix-turn-helix domain-containing protein [Bacteroidetes bacterium]|nr:MAG: helix-turn-helix domain-containing protein [Bacteroidota bacterium]